MTSAPKSLVVSYSLASIDYWIELEQVAVEPIQATMEEVSNTVDRLYGADPCNKYEHIETPITKELDEEASAADKIAAEVAKFDFFKDTVKASFSLPACNVDAVGNCVVQIKVKVSDPSLPYRLRVTNGVVGLTRKEGDHDLVDITITGSPDGSTGKSRVLGFYMGNVAELDLEAPDNEEASSSDKQAYCGDWTGDFRSNDRADIITCYERVTTEYRCQCDYSIAYTTEDEVVVPCPSSIVKCDEGLFSDAYDDEYGITHCSSYMGSRRVFGDFVSCAGTTYYNNQTGEVYKGEEDSILAKEDYYKFKCCHSSGKTLPNCQTKYERNPGGSTMDPGIQAEYEHRYGDRVKFIPVHPDDGDCGYIKTVVNVAQRNCCDDVVPIVWDKENSAEVMADFSSGIVVVTGGRPPFSVSVRGQGFYLDKERRVRDGVVSTGEFMIYTGESCGVANITVTDGCSSVAETIFSTKGQWKSRGGFGPPEGMVAFAESQGLFHCSFYDYPVGYTFPARSGKYCLAYTVESAGASSIHTTFLHDSSIYGLWGGADEAVVWYTNPAYPGIALPVFYAPITWHCAGSGEPSGEWFTYWNIQSVPDIYEFTC